MSFRLGCSLRTRGWLRVRYRYRTSSRLWFGRSLRTRGRLRVRYRYRTSSRLWFGRSLRTRGRLRVRYRYRTSSGLRNSRTRLRCGLRTWSRLCVSYRFIRLCGWARHGRFCCSVFSCLVFGSLILIGFVFSGLILGCFVLGGLTFSCFGLGCFILDSFIFSCFVLSCFIRCGSSCCRLVFRSLVRRSCLFGRNYSLTAKLPRLRRCSDCWSPLVHRSKELVVGTGSLHMLSLRRCWLRVFLVCRCLFCSVRACGDSTRTAVIADIICGVV